MVVKSLSPKSYLKKSQEGSDTLPSALKLLVAQGSSLTIEESAPLLREGYWLVTLREL